MISSFPQVSCSCLSLPWLYFDLVVTETRPDLLISLRITMTPSSRINSTTSTIINQNHQNLATLVSLYVLADSGFSDTDGLMLVTGGTVEGCVSTFIIVEEISGLLIVEVLVLSIVEAV